jgi:hypothetical protein
MATFHFSLISFLLLNFFFPHNILFIYYIGCFVFVMMQEFARNKTIAYE